MARPAPLPGAIPTRGTHCCVGASRQGDAGLSFPLLRSASARASGAALGLGSNAAALPLGKLRTIWALPSHLISLANACSVSALFFTSSRLWPEASVPTSSGIGQHCDGSRRRKIACGEWLRDGSGGEGPDPAAAGLCSAKPPPSCLLAEVLLPQLLHRSQLEPDQSPWASSVPVCLHSSLFCSMPCAGSWEMICARDPTTACGQLTAPPSSLPAP